MNRFRWWHQFLLHPMALSYDSTHYVCSCGKRWRV